MSRKGQAHFREARYSCASGAASCWQITTRPTRQPFSDSRRQSDPSNVFPTVELRVAWWKLQGHLESRAVDPTTSPPSAWTACIFLSAPLTYTNRQDEIGRQGQYARGIAAAARRRLAVGGLYYSGRCFAVVPVPVPPIAAVELTLLPLDSASSMLAVSE